MKRTLKLFSLVLSIALMVGITSGCSGKDKVSDDVSVESIAEKVVAAIGTEEGNMTPRNDSYISGFMKTDVSNFDEYTIYRNNYGTEIIEFGIFKGSDKEHTEKIQGIVDNYLEMLPGAYMDNYNPEERPKLEAAKSILLGNYVMYAVLDQEGQDLAFEAFENALKK